MTSESGPFWRSASDDRESALEFALHGLLLELDATDVVRLKAGDVVPGDRRLLMTRHLFVNQALLTGEPYPVEACQ